MFRIESYVTPIILSYVDKYVKNIRPQDSQMSLWGGEVSFQNLDLRLDVLEEELNLPFCTFLSGHIHELVISVPWTKIASEPISVTINTIEFVLKLKDPENGTPRKQASSKRKKISKYEEPPTSPTGYMATLVNKIANNISIQCHNIIFKYVEEDLVMSMNIQLLSINSADANWKPAFVDISPTKVVLRKIIQVTNLTICLDKRNEIGKIEMCQEPILYRCSMNLHLLRRYNAPTSHKASLLRCDLHSDSMLINVSSVQFPMAMRLFNLLQALKDGSLEKRLQQGAQSQTTESNENLDEDGEGFISWAWNLLPTIFPEENESDASDEINEHITHFGYAIDNIQVTFKHQEPSSSDSHAKKVKYQSLFQLQFNGCRGQSIGVGRRWSTFQGSIQGIQMTPFEKCVCGKTQSVDYFIKSHNRSLETPSGSSSTPMEESPEVDLYNTNWDQYFVTRSDDYLRSLTASAMVVDICYSIEVSDDNSTRLSEVGSDLEESGLRERHLMRIFCNNLQFKLGPSVSHLQETLKGYAAQYNYPPYLAVKQIPGFNQLSPPSSDDYEALMSEVPLRKYDLQMSGTSILFDFADHKSNAENKRLQEIPLTCTLRTTRVKYVTPFYPNRLVFTTCQLPQWPMKLFDACYQRIDVSSSAIDVQLGGTQIGHIPNLDAYSREIIYPQLWQDPNVLAKDQEVNVPSLELGNIQSHILGMINDILCGPQIVTRKGLISVAEEAIVHIKLQELKWIKFETRCTLVQQLKLQNVFGSINDRGKISEFLRLNAYKDSQNCLDFLLQTPLDEEEVNPAVIAANLGQVQLVCDNSILQLIKNIEMPRTEGETTDRKISIVEDSTTKSTINKQSLSNKDQRTISRRSGSVALESVHSSSEKNTTVVVPNVPKEETAQSSSIKDLFDKYKSKIISCDLKGPILVMDFTDGKCVQKIRFPDIIMTTTGGRVGELKRKVPVSNEALDIVDKKRFFFPWTFQFIDFCCDIESGGNVFTVVESLKSNVTLLINEKAVETSSADNPFLPDSLEFVIHIDTTPIVVNLSEIAVNYLTLNWKTLQDLHLFSQIQVATYQPTEETNQIEIAKRPISPDSSFDLKKLFDSSATVDTKERDDSLTDVTEVQKEAAAHEAVPSIWMQLAFEKFHVNLFHNAEMEKLSLKAEDVICSWDQKESYSKLKAKVGAISGKFMTLATGVAAEPGKWNTDESLSFLGRNNEPSNVAFIDLTVTRAGTGIVHSKWGVKKKHRYMNNNLIEVMLKMQSIECKLDLEKVSRFARVFDGIRANIRPLKLAKEGGQNDPGTVISVADLPLVFFECKGIQVYLPVIQESASSSTVFVLKVQEISISPTVENPLTRNPVRADIYTKATQLGILNLPGSKIEDRQYEVQFKQISLDTADWTEMLCYMSNLGIGYENPAVVWNNPTKDETLEISEVFKDFNCNIVWAPAIVFNNVLVCGPSIELSCVSDLNLKIQPDQCESLVKLNEVLSVITTRPLSQKSLQQTARIFKDKSFYNDLKASAKKSKALKIFMNSTTPTDLKDSQADRGSRQSDSGVGSMRVTRKQSKASTKDYKLNIPYDVTFLGGNFFINLFERYHKTDDDDKRPVDVPMIKILLYQPNITLTQSIYDRTVNMGVFNMTIQLPEEDHTDEIFNSHQGKLNALGIPPSVWRLKFTESVTMERMLTINLFRPMKLKISQRILKKIERITESLSTVTTKTDVGEEMTPLPNTAPKDWIRGTKVRLFDATKVSFSITQLECIYEERQKLNVIISQLSTNCLIQDRKPNERMTVEMLIKGVSVKTNELVLLHPTLFSLTAVLAKEFWQRNPVITLSGGCNFMQLDIGPKNVICLQEILKSFEGMKDKSPASPKTVSSAPPNKKLSADHLIRLMTPKPPPAMDAKNEEYYQDDLRAGAFQFVEVASDRHLPLPYQIQVINRKENRIICWRYPQARAIFNVEILPVPFHIVSMAVVKCYIEFYSESHGEFMAYCEFPLSESHKQTLKLPHKKVTACVWRVVMRTPTVSVNGKLFEEESSSVEEGLSSSSGAARGKNAGDKGDREPLIYNINDILQSPDDEYDGPEDRSNNSMLTLHPKILIACMKVDSYFNPALIANCNLYFHLNQLEINVLNQLVADEFTLPKVLANYKGPCNVLPLHQQVGKIRVDNCKIGANVFDDLNLDLQWEFGFEVNLVDYAYLRLMPFVEHFRCTGYYDCVGDLEGARGACGNAKKNILNLMIPSSLKIRQNPSIVHTLYTMNSIWNNCLKSDDVQATKELILMTRLIICNSTSAVLYYGQTESTDLYPVLPKGFDFYAFKSVISAQALDFAIDGESGRVRSETCPIGEEKEECCLRLGNSFIVVTIKSISSTQRLITVRGQMEIFNLSREKFVVEIGTEEERKPLMLLDKSASIVSQRNLEELNVLRICFESIGHWSGDIPIRPSGKRLPWLVKVPVAKNKYLSYWLRIVKSRVSDDFSRIVVIVLPLYLVRSYLPKDTIVEELKLQKTCQVFGKGALNELHLMGTHDDEHILKFNENFRTAMGQDRSEILLSYKAMDVAKLFPTLEDEQTINVPQLIQAFEGFSYEAKGVEWPVASQWESRITRMVSEPEHFIPLCDFGSLLLSEEKWFNSLVLEVAPWCIFINSCGLNVFLKNNQRSMCIEANHLGTPFDFVDNKFTLQFDAGGDGEYLESPEIHLGLRQASKKDIVLVDGEVLPLEILSESGRYLLKMILTSRKVKNRRVLILSSRYVAVNYTKYNLSLFAITVPVATDKNMFFSQGLFPSPEVGRYTLKSGAGGEKDIRGITMPIINHEFIAAKKKPKKIEAKLQYLIISSTDGQESEDVESFCPINVTDGFSRKTLNFSVPGPVGKGMTDSVSLIVSLIKENEQFFLTITEDPSPDVQLHNRTDYNLCVAQSESLTKLVGPVRECEHFQWFQVLPRRSVANYSPSVVYKSYPQLTSNNANCGLTLAVTTMDGSQLRWTQPFCVTAAGEFFLALPGKSDVKVIVNADRKTVSVVIEAVNTSQEFSLRNVRSRLLHPIVEEIEDAEEKQQENEGVPEDKEKEISIKEPLRLQFTLFVKEIGLFVATEDKQQAWTKEDIVSVTLDDVLVEFDSQRRKLGVEFGNIQIDNQLAHTGCFDFPVVFCADDSELLPRDIPSASVFYLNEIVSTQQANPLMRLAIKLYSQEMDIEELECTVHPIRLYLEDTYLGKLGDALTELLPQSAVYSSDVEVERVHLTTGNEVVIPKHLELAAKSLATPLKMKVFKIGNLDVLISLHTSTRFYIALDHSPLSFSAFERVNLRTTEMKLGSSISMHYFSGAIFGAGWMVGSLEILGSPSGLARSVTTGLKDFVSMPVEGLFKGPWEFMTGVTTGSLSLLRNITAGTVNSVTKLAASVARNLDRLTLDAEHVQRTDLVRRYKPHGVAEGFTQGLTQFGITLLGAIGGISRHTMAARTPGQVLSGVGKGLMGVILKPISGAAELVAYTGNGVLHSVGYNTLPSCRILSAALGVLSPSQCQLSWKILQPIMDTNQILFTHIVTLIKEQTLVPSFFGFSETVVLSLNLNTDEVVIFPMSVVHPQVDANDPTIVHLRIVSRIPPTEDNDQFLNYHHIASRVREYIQSSREHLPMCGTAAAEVDLSPEVPIVEGFVIDKTISFYVQSDLAQHIVDYMMFLKYYYHEKYSI